MYLLVVVSNSGVAERDCNWWFTAPVCMTPKTNGDNSIWLHAMRFSLLLKEMFFSKALNMLSGSRFSLWIFQSNGFCTLVPV